jgi:hypothetical protein
MDYLVAALLLAVLLIAIAALGISRGYDLVELTFHPPIFVKLKLTRTRHR